MLFAEQSQAAVRAATLALTNHAASLSQLTDSPAIIEIDHDSGIALHGTITVKGAIERVQVDYRNAFLGSQASKCHVNTLTRNGVPYDD